jgi:hypothetical protein
MDILIIIIGVLASILLGYYLGNGQRVKDEARTIKKFIDKITENSEIKVIPKKEPKAEITEILKELDKN